MSQEGALIAFTLLSQGVAGAAFVYALFHFVRQSDVSKYPSGFHAGTPELLLLAGLLTAMVLSLFHLGHVLRAGFAMSNLGNSWLSREILALSLFALSLFLLFLGRWLIPARRGVLNGLFLATMVSGPLLVAVMIRLYRVPAVASWNSWYTPASFILTSLVLGMCTVLVYRVFVLPGGDLRGNLIRILILLLLFEALVSGMNQVRLDNLPVIHYNEFILGNTHLAFTIFRIAFIAAIIALLAVIGRKGMANRGVSHRWFVAITVLLVVAEQVAGRWLFFASYVKVGI